jgi:hypothetical protein
MSENARENARGNEEDGSMANEELNVQADYLHYIHRPRMLQSTLATAIPNLEDKNRLHGFPNWKRPTKTTTWCGTSTLGLRLRRLKLDMPKA